MNFNNIAKLIHSVIVSHSDYEDTVLKINFHSSLIKHPEELKIEELNYESFDENYLTNLHEYWDNKTEELEKKYKEIIYEVDSDDYK